MPRPPRPLDARRTALLREAAAESFASQGLNGASLNEILTRAQMGKSSFYHYFADKAALHDWVAETLSAELVSAIRPPELSELTAVTFRPELSALLDRMEAVAAARPELMELGRMFHNSTDVAPERAIARTRARMIDWLTEALLTGRQLGIIRADLPAELLTAWTIASLTTIDQWVLTSEHHVDATRDTATTAIGALWQLLRES